jgi:hypothetical protein
MTAERAAQVRSGSKPLSLVRWYRACGSLWKVASNDRSLFHAFAETFHECRCESHPPDMTINLYVDPDLTDDSPRRTPFFRSLDHLVYASYGFQNIMVMDLRCRHVTGFCSSRMAADTSYWKAVVLPVLLGTIAPSIRITPLHCACLVQKGKGLLVGGQSGCGKSTIALELALHGFEVLSDDWTYVSLRDSEVTAWGVLAPIKLLPDAVTYFPELRAERLDLSLNGEIAYEVDPVVRFGIRRSDSCKPGVAIFLERVTQRTATFHRLSPEEASFRLMDEVETLPDSLADFADLRNETIARLAEGGCWLLRHGLEPKALASEIIQFWKREAQI